MKRKKKKEDIISQQEYAEIICLDFKRFCKYLTENDVRISKDTGCIGKKACFELNQFFHRKEAYERGTRFQDAYPVINFFHYVAVKNKILEFTPSGTRLIRGRK